MKLEEERMKRFNKQRSVAHHYLSLLNMTKMS